MTTLITAKAELERLESNRAEIAETLEHLKQDISDLREQLRSGEVGKGSDASKALNELRYWLRAARETELEIETLRRKEAGIVGDYGLDLENARSEIWCRLDRLRRCHAATAVCG